MFLFKNEADCKIHSLSFPSKLNSKSNLLNLNPDGKIKVEYFDFDKIIDSINKNQLEKMPDNNDLLDGYFSVRNQSFKMIIERLGKIKKISNAKCHKILWRDQLWLLLKSLKSEFIQLEKQKLVSNKLKGFNWKYVSKVNEKINLSKIDQIEIKPKYKNKELYIFSCTK